jgi:hypothetical protein
VNERRLFGIGATITLNTQKARYVINLPEMSERRWI